MLTGFAKDADGSFLWPGFGENIRVLKWISERLNGAVDARNTPIGLVPHHASDLSVAGLSAVPSARLNHFSRSTGKKWTSEGQHNRDLPGQSGRGGTVRTCSSNKRISSRGCSQPHELSAAQAAPHTVERAALGNVAALCLGNRRPSSVMSKKGPGEEPVGYKRGG